MSIISESDIATARRSAKVSDMTRKDVIKMLVANIGYAAMASGKLLESDMQIFIAREIYREVIEDNPDLSVDEVAIVFRRGVYKGFGDYFGLNAVTIVGWFEAYLKSEKRNRVMKEELMVKLVVAHESREEIKRKNDEACRFSALAFLKDAKDNDGKVHAMDFHKSVVYDYLSRKGLVVPFDIDNNETSRKMEIRMKANALDKFYMDLYENGNDLFL